MKRLLIVLCVICSISITQYGNAKEYMTNNENVNVEFSMQNDWEDLGTILAYYVSGRDVRYSYAQLYVKVVSGKTFYKIKLTTGYDINEEYAVSKNPRYNPNGTEWYQKYTHMAGNEYYFNL